MYRCIIFYRFDVIKHPHSTRSPPAVRPRSANQPTSPHYRYPSVRSRNSQPVSVTELSSVVMRTAAPERSPLLPKPFAMTKEVTVVGEPHMMTAASSVSFRNPSQTATGMKIIPSPASFRNTAISVSFRRERMRPARMEAPRARRPRGVAVALMLERVRSAITGKRVPDRDQARPRKILMIRGFFRMFSSVCRNRS